MKYRHLLLASVFSLAIAACSPAATNTSKDSSNANDMGKNAQTVKALTFDASSNAKVEGLLSKMTIDEKLAQITCVWFDKVKALDSDGSFNAEKMKETFPHGVGCWARPQDTFGMEEQAEDRDANDSSLRHIFPAVYCASRKL